MDVNLDTTMGIPYQGPNIANDNDNYIPITSDFSSFGR